MDQSASDQQLITLEGEDGQLYPCRLLGVFPFAGEEYALLMHVTELNAEDTHAGSLVVMRLVSHGDQAIFQRIESDEEFERVMTFIKERAREMGEEKES